MTKAEILKKEILRQYRSVRQFAMEMNIPYSTLVTALERGIEGMAYGTVIKMCDKLSLNPVDFHHWRGTHPWEHSFWKIVLCRIM